MRKKERHVRVEHAGATTWLQIPNVGRSSASILQGERRLDAKRLDALTPSRAARVARACTEVQALRQLPSQFCGRPVPGAVRFEGARGAGPAPLRAGETGRPCRQRTWSPPAPPARGPGVCGRSGPRDEVL